MYYIHRVCVCIICIILIQIPWSGLWIFIAPHCLVLFQGSVLFQPPGLNGKAGRTNPKKWGADRGKILVRGFLRIFLKARRKRRVGETHHKNGSPFLMGWVVGSVCGFCSFDCLSALDCID